MIGRRLSLAPLAALALVGLLAVSPPSPPGTPPAAPTVTRIIATGPAPVVEIRVGGGDVEVLPGTDDSIALVAYQGAAVSTQRGAAGQTFYLTTERQVDGHLQRIARVVTLPQLNPDQTLVRITVNWGDVKLRLPPHAAALVLNDTNGGVTIRDLRKTRVIVRSFGSLAVASSRLTGESYLQVTGDCELRDVSGDYLSVGLLGGQGRARNVRARTLEVSGQGASLDWELAANRGDMENFAIETGELLLRVPDSVHASIVANSTAGSLGGILQGSAAPFGMEFSASRTFRGGGANVAITAEASSVNVVRSKS
ncbi:hypothetical protein EPN44_05010 [bacterium]|nr:MAG: hypothetical protein EPN44_05010 [bacterium]